MNGTWDISVYTNLDTVISNLKNCFFKADLEFHNGESVGLLQVSQLLSYFKKNIWILKNRQNLDALEEVLLESILDFDSLFSIDSTFINLICQQELESSRMNILTLTSSIAKDSISYSQIQDVYPHKTNQELLVIFTNAFGKAKISDNDVIPKTDLIKTFSRFA